MNTSMFDANLDFFQLNKICYKAENQDACDALEIQGVAGLCKFDEQERVCQIGNIGAAKYGEKEKTGEG